MDKVKSIKFNLENADDLEAYNYAISQGNFSGFIKWLILKERYSRKSPIYRSDTNGAFKIFL
ncbi:hypothetical protein NC797_06910 [Aquibacillus sp. 3ASR75-11]|uniref:Uncharacterized protein n=1 Tax=Terrihalobacillus insolitus TaxID=2950438 RepID=A0A9X4ALC8_9BACI|nr:hypothetical protein [Terrihalobacillus insolitus]MDC3424237.1 hypothetical protein [Terrihalobacillus insolitus]